jgi:hypothetical protein
VPFSFNKYFMFLFQYLDQLPKVPLDLLKNGHIEDQTRIGWRQGGYVRWPVSTKLDTWLATNLGSDLFTRSSSGMQFIRDAIKPHCDLRAWALNYIIATGGEKVETIFWQEQDQPLLRESGTYRNGTTSAKLDEVWKVQIEPNRWHLINTNVIHSVTGVTDIQEPRQGISISVMSRKPLEHIQGYQGKLS